MAHGMIKLPFVGEIKTGYAIAGGAAVFAIVGYAYYRHAQGASSASSASSSADTSATGTDPQTGYPYGSPEDTAALAALNGTDTSASDIDPETGYPYGSEQDQEALSGIGGYGLGETGGGGYYDYAPTTPPPVTTDVAVPQVTGSGQSRALSAIRNAGLTPFPSTTNSSDGNVTSQSPAAGTQVASGTTVYWSAKAKAKAKPKPTYKSFTANGTLDLDNAAKIRHTTAAQIIEDTEQHSPGSLVRNYIARGDWKKKLPRGSKWYY